jgi:hypothetical protein
VKPIEQPHPFAGHVVAAFRQQPQSGVIAFGDDGAQLLVTDGRVRDAGGICSVGLAAAAGVQQAGERGERGRHVDDVLAGRGQQLSDAASQTGGAFDSEAALRPAGGPVAQRLYAAALTVIRRVASS